jgi:hypothetical protein
VDPMNGPKAFQQEPSELPEDPAGRHEALVDLFGQFVFWIRNSTIRATRIFVHSEAAREKLGTVRGKYYDAVARMSPEDRESALQLAEQAVNGFLQRLIWCLGNGGTDARFGKSHAYRFRVEMEIVDIDTAEIVEVASINRGKKFFGKYFGRWLNRHRDK